MWKQQWGKKTIEMLLKQRIQEYDNIPNKFLMVMTYQRMAMRDTKKNNNALTL